MPIDTSIYAGLLGPQKNALDYANEYARGDAMRNQNALQSMQFQQAAQSNAAKMGMRNALSALGPQATVADQIGALRAQGTPEALQQAEALDTGQMNRKKIDADAAQATSVAAKNNDETLAAKRQRHFSDLATVNTPEDALAWGVEGVHLGIIDPSKFPQSVQALQQAAQTPEGFAQWKAQALQSATAAQEQLKDQRATPQEVQLGNVVKFIDMNPHSATFGHEIAPAQAKGVSPDTAYTQKHEDSRSALSRQAQFTIAGVNPDGTPSGGGGLLDEATIANAAARYNTDGTLPPNLGRGKQGPHEIASILKEASVQAAARGDTPEEQRVAQLSNKANSQALNKLQSQQTMVGAFEKNFTKNADMAQQLSQQMDSTGVPLVNKWINAGKRSLTGDPTLSALDTSVKATVNEYAKIVSGSSGSAGAAQGEIAKVEGLLNSAQNADQVKAVLDLMRRETQNRMTSFDEEKSQLTTSMTRRPKSTGGVPDDIAAILAKHGGK